MSSKKNIIKSYPRQHAQSISVPGTLSSATIELLDDYRLSLEASGRSPKTISSYFDILTRYFSFLQSDGKAWLTNQLGRRELNTYLLYLKNCERWPNRKLSGGDYGKLSPFTVQDHARTIKAFWGWLLREGYIDKNPLEKFPLPSVPRPLIKIITSEVFEKLLLFIDRNIPIGAQHYCIMLILYDCGGRISEILNCLAENVDLNLGFIKVLGKGNKERQVPISRPTIREIRRYIHDFRLRICPVESPYLFPRPDGTPVSINSIQQFMRRLVQKSGIEGLRLHPHLLRHSFGTQFIINGGNLFYLKDIMGHASLSTTLKYTHLQPEDLRREHIKFSPVGNLRINQERGHVRAKSHVVLR